MIRFVYGDELHKFPYLKQTMFQDRADQFKRRLGWDVSVDLAGEERDQYDALNPLYIIWEGAGGRHGGSLRALPTVGRTMAAEHFLHLTHGVKIESPLIWEVTRFCLAPDAGPGVAAALMMAGCELALRFGIEQGLGVFDAIYGIGEVGYHPKPDPRAFAAVLEAHDIDPARAAMFEDDPRNLEVPFSLGMRTVLVGPGRHGPDPLAADHRHGDHVLWQTAALGDFVAALAAALPGVAMSR